MGEFARLGLEGARVDAIAASAGMNKRMLYHYVGHKEALFAAAVAEAAARLAGGRADADAWRVLCHASALGRCPDLRPLAAEAVAASPDPETALDRLARGLMGALLPELAGAVRARAGAPGGQVAGRGGGTPEEAGAKPRVKLRPSLRSGSAG